MMINLISIYKKRKMTKKKEKESIELLMQQLNDSIELFVKEINDNKDKSFVQILQENVNSISMPIRKEYLILLENIQKENYK